MLAMDGDSLRAKEDASDERVWMEEAVSVMTWARVDAGPCPEGPLLLEGSIWAVSL